MKKWFGNVTAVLFVFTFYFMALPKFLWDLGHKKSSAFVLFMEFTVIIVIVGLIWFLVAAYRAIVN